MKKFLPILLAGFVAITVVACGGEEEAAEGEEAATEEGAEEAPADKLLPKKLLLRKVLISIFNFRLKSRG